MRSLPGRQSRSSSDIPPASVTRAGAHADQRRRILRAIAELTGVRGYGDVTVELIVKRAHVSFKTLYKHYAGKEECLLDLCESAFDGTERTIRERLAAEAAPWPDQVALVLRTLIDLIVARLGLPLYVKPSRGGSALGAGPVHEAAELPAALLSCFAYGDIALIERFIAGTEVTVGVIDLGAGPQALPAVEIVPGDGGYDYTARYTAGKTEFYVPARLPGEVAAQVARIAGAVHSVLGLRDLSRTDLIVDETGTPYFLEVNVSPGMTETSTLPMALEASGHSFGSTCVRLLQLAAARGA